MAPEKRSGFKIRGLSAAEEVEEPPAKQARQAPKPEELHKGAVVLYGSGKRGVVRDAYGPLDEFWVADETTGDLVRDGATGDIKSFKSSELRLPPAQRPQPAVGGGLAARVFLLGTEQHMLQALEHFGSPDASQRQEPQQLLAIPCASCKCGPFCARFDPMSRGMCDAEVCPTCHVAGEGVDESMCELARSLRPDIHVGIRAYHLKHAIEQVGPDINKLTGHYALSSVTLPFGQADIEKSKGWEKYFREEVRCQIDIGVTAEGAHEEGEDSPEATARRALGESCGICISNGLWSEEEQFALRRKLGVDIPLKYWDGEQCKIFVIILPESARASIEDSILVFTEGGAAAHSATTGPGTSSGTTAAAAQGGEQTVGGKTASQWRADQEQFKHLPQLPADWIRIKSKKGDDVYFFNLKTNKSTFDFPLPEGWTKQVSKSTSKSYYFNARKRKSMFEIPTERD